MREALKGVPETVLQQPPGIVTVRIDPESGLLVSVGFPNAIFESFRKENVPNPMLESKKTGMKDDDKSDTFEAPEQLF